MTTLLVASAGGHLKQLVQLAPRIEGVGNDPLWVSWDSPQTRSLLQGRRTVFVRPTPPRSPLAVSSNLDYAVRLWRFSGAHQLISTGSQLVLPFAVVGRLSGKACHFIESAARASDHSLTARMLSRIPGMRLYTQYPSAADNWNVGALCPMLAEWMDPAEPALLAAQDRLDSAVEAIIEKSQAEGGLRTDVGAGDILTVAAQIARPLPAPALRTTTSTCTAACNSSSTACVHRATPSCPASRPTSGTCAATAQGQRTTEQLFSDRRTMTVRQP